MPRGVQRTKQEKPLPNTVPEHEQLIDDTNKLISQVEENVDRMRLIRGQVNECINQTETFLSSIASGAPKAVRTPANALR